MILQSRIGNKQRRRELANQFKDAKNPLKIVILGDMWLTGFNAPCLHTMYADKPMQGHGLMQAIARASCVFHDKPKGKKGVGQDLSQSEVIPLLPEQAAGPCFEATLPEVGARTSQ